MKLLEIFNTKVNVEWEKNNHQNTGKFILDDIDYKIHIDEHEVLNKILIDFGFDANGSIDIVNSGKNSAKIIGAVLNGSISKIEEINPDVILIGISKHSENIENRKSLYSTIVSWLQKRSSYMFDIEWIENEHMFFKIIAKKKLTTEELKVFSTTVKSK